MRVFKLVRREDVSGVSGTGEIAEGVEFMDGTVVLKWLVPLGHSGGFSIFKTLDDVRAIHGHDGRTQVLFAFTDAIW